MARPPLFGRRRVKSTPQAGPQAGWSNHPAMLRRRYQRAGCYERLCLWTQHRDLRSEFDAMAGFWDPDQPGKQTS